MRFSFGAMSCCVNILLLACNKHDAGTKPPALSSQKPTSLLLFDSGVNLASEMDDGAAAETPPTAETVASDAGDHETHRGTPRDTSADMPVSAGVCRVLVVGDSLSDPRSNGGGYLKPWARHCPHCQFNNIARGGAMVNQMLRALREHLSVNRIRYSAVVVFGGVNDLYSNETANRTNARIQRDLSSIFGLARSNAARVFVITIAPWGGFRRWYTEERGRNTQALNDWILASVARREVDSVVESGPLLTCGDPERLCPEYMAPYRDGLHFGPEGHRRLGAALLRSIGETCRGSPPRPHQ